MKQAMQELSRLFTAPLQFIKSLDGGCRVALSNHSNNFFFQMWLLIDKDGREGKLAIPKHLVSVFYGACVS